MRDFFNRDTIELEKIRKGVSLRCLELDRLREIRSQCERELQAAAETENEIVEVPNLDLGSWFKKDKFRLKGKRWRYGNVYPNSETMQDIRDRKAKVKGILKNVGLTGRQNRKPTPWVL